MQPPHKNSEQDVINVYSLQKKSQMYIPEEFELFHFTRTAVDVLNKMEVLNSKLHCLFKKKMKRIKDNLDYYASIGNTT